MGRPPKYSTDDVLDAAAAILADGGPTALTAAGVARQLSAPSGSVYHRFGTRDELAAALWMRTVERFDTDVVTILAGPGDAIEVAVAAARAMVAWTRANPTDAVILTLFRREDLTNGGADGELADRARSLARRQRAMIAHLAQRLQRDPDEVAFAVAGIPMAAVRSPIERRTPIPDWVDDAVERAVRSVLTPPPASRTRRRSR